MTVMSTVHIPGMTDQAYDQSAEQLIKLVRQQPGFIMHAACPNADGYTIVEFWETAEHANTWYDAVVRPATRPMGVPEFQAEFKNVHRLVTREEGDPHMTASDQNVATIRAAYEAFGRQDIPAVLAAFDPQIEWYAPDELPIGGTFHGHDGVLSFFQSLPGYFDELHVEPESFLASGDQVVVVGHHRGKVNGRPFEIGFAMVWTMRNGKAIKFREYNDSGKLLRIAAGESVPA